MTDTFAWHPSKEVIERAQLTRFMSFCGIDSFDALYKRSIEDVEWFTEQVLRFLNIRFDDPYTKILDLSKGIEWPRWCVGAKLNITKSCLDNHLENKESANRSAIICEGEEGNIRTLSYSQLNDKVNLCAAGLRSIGITKGDAIGIHLPMISETVIAMLAINKIGAMAVPLFSGYGPSAIESRLRDVEAKALFTCDGFPRRGKTVATKPIADEAISNLPSIKHVFVVRRSNNEIAMRGGRDLFFDRLCELGSQHPELSYTEITNADDPLIAIYTSGTTGKPKGILHTHYGFPVKSAQDMCFGTDVGGGTRISWLTDIGWMMGPWLIYGSLILGGTMVLFDGAPDYPNPDRLWSFVENHKIEVLGISPTLIRALSAKEGGGDEWAPKHDISSLRIFGSTGEPWNPDPWHWLFDKVGKKKVPIINYSGGTEISGGILMGNPLLPIKPCSFPAPCPGIAADVIDDKGNSVRNSVGELVIRNTWIGQACGFWKDPERYLDTYWSRIPGIWVHGDWAMIDDDGSWYILGRSDDTIKIAGKRVGPAEVESIAVSHPSVAEAAAIGVPDELKGNALIIFCVRSSADEPDDKLSNELKTMIAAELGKPLAPKKVLFVSALPKTRNGKVMRRIVRAAYLGEDTGDTTALENPAIVEEIKRVES